MSNTWHRLTAAEALAATDSDDGPTTAEAAATTHSMGLAVAGGAP